MTEKHLRDFLLRLTATVLAVLMAFGPGGGPLEAKTRKGDRYFKDAQAAETRQDYDVAVELYQQAVNEDPRDASYLIAIRRARFQAAQEHLRKGRDFRTQGNMADAIAEFQRAILIDPSLSIALQELKRTQDLITNPEIGPDANLTPVERNDREGQERSESILGLPELNPPVRRVGPLKMNNQPFNILYSTVASIAGINIVIDSTWTNRPTRNFDVDMPEMDVEQALDYLALITHTFWKPLTPTTIFLTEDSDNKRRDYEDLVVKTFFLTNAATPQEFLEMTTAIRSITDIRRVYPYNALKAMVVRGRADEVALAEKLVRDLDRPKSEVVIDVIIMTANTSHTRDLAATIANAGAAGLNMGVNFAPRPGISRAAAGATGGGTSVALADLGRLSTADFTTSLPGALLQAIVSDATTRILTNPQVRASDGQKVTLNVGDRVPVASGSFQSAVGGAGGVNTQFQYINVGVNVDITPQVHSANEVTLHVDLEVSSVKGSVTQGNVTQPIIGQDKTTADLRLREGEINILAGLSSLQNSQAVTGLPGLVNIPILGKILFGTDHTERDRGELMIALIPHIIRTPDYSAESLRGVYAGLDQRVKLLRAPKTDSDQTVPAPAAPAVTPGPLLPNAAEPQVPANAPPANPPPNTPATAPQTPPQSAQPGVNLPNLLPGVAGGPPAAAPPQVPAPAGSARVTFLPGVITAARNAPFTVDLQLENVTQGGGVTPVRVTWDPAVLRLNDIAPGELFTRDGQRITSVKDIRNDMGQATLSISRPAGAPGITGSGVAATLTFVAIAPGNGRVAVTEMGLTDANSSRSLNVTLGTLPVAVQ